MTIMAMTIGGKREVRRQQMTKCGTLVWVITGERMNTCKLYHFIITPDCIHESMKDQCQVLMNFEIHSHADYVCR